MGSSAWRSARPDSSTAPCRRPASTCSSTSRRPPFDDVRVRRALNQATDRDPGRRPPRRRDARRSELPDRAGRRGRPRAVMPVRSGLGAATRRGRRPTRKRAQRLMAASGRAGERVTVWMPKSREALGRYFAGLLDALGLRASLRVIADEHYFAAIFNPRNRRSDRIQELAGRLPHGDDVHPELRLHAGMRPISTQSQLLRSCAGSPDRSGARGPGRRSRQALGGRGPPHRRPCGRGAAHQPAHRRARSPSASATSSSTRSGWRCSTRCGSADQRAPALPRRRSSRRRCSSLAFSSCSAFFLAWNSS